MDLAEKVSDKKVIEAINAKIESLKKEAEQIVGSYWAYVEESNEVLFAEKKRGERIKEKPINVGPRLERSPSGQYTKFKPVWTQYVLKRRKTGKPLPSDKYGERIHPKANKEYSLSTLVRRGVGRDASKIIEAEKKLMVIRESLEVHHEMIVALNRRIKRVNRINNVYNEVTND